MKMFNKNKKDDKKAAEPEKSISRFETIDSLGLKRRVEISPAIVYFSSFDQDFKNIVDADELEQFLRNAIKQGESISQATGFKYAKLDHKDAVSKKELSEALNQASEDLKIFKSSDVLAKLAKRINEAGIK